MIVLYHCYGAAHSSVLSAAIHLGLLADDRIPGLRKLGKYPILTGKKQKRLVSPFYMALISGVIKSMSREWVALIELSSIY